MFWLLSEQYIVDIFLYIQYILPDFIIRFVIRNFLYYTDTNENEELEKRIVEQINQSEKTTYEVEKANEQHYEVSTDFFIHHLGNKLKYSSCEWYNTDKNDNIRNIHDAEIYTIRKYQKLMKLDDLNSGDTILEIGNGWGSLCLTNAIDYPHLQFESFSNSRTQIEYIQSQIETKNIKNLKIWKQDIDYFVKSETDQTQTNKYKRVVSIECIEHCRGYALLFEKISNIITDDGFCFFQILAHTKHTMIMSQNTWMGRNFFSGGTIPRVDLFSKFNQHLQVYDTHVVNGNQYAKTLDSWLYRMYQDKNILSLLHNSYDYQKWRMFYLLCSECFGFDKGYHYVVAYIYMNKKK
jgi:cyclopropane-fatty-acyl-phospholipid synthase